MKKFLAAFGIMAGLIAAAGIASAANPESIRLRVTPGGFVRDITVSTALVDFGTLNLGSTNNISASSVTVTLNNTSNVSSTFALRIDTAHAGGTTWTPGAAAGANAYNLRAIFHNNVVPAPADFGAEDNMSAVSAPSTTQATTGVYTAATSTEDGVLVPVNGSRGLWFKLDMPTTTSVTGAQDIYTEVLAQ